MGIDLADAAGDVALTLCVPGDGAQVVDVSITIETAGTGASANHLVTLEQGTAGAGAAIASVMTLDADGAVGLTATAKGTRVKCTRGVALQLANAESAAISNGAIVNLVIVWAM
jgi:hypothetical protein